MFHKHPMTTYYSITVLEQTIKNRHFRVFHLFSSVYKPGDMTRTEMKKGKENALVFKCTFSGFSFFLEGGALNCNFVHDLSTTKFS